MRASLLFAAAVSLAQAGTALYRPVERSTGSGRSWISECRACDDFNRFANGGWLDRTVIPPGRSSWSTYDEVEADVRNDLQEIIAEGIAAAQAGRTRRPGQDRYLLLDLHG